MSPRLVYAAFMVLALAVFLVTRHFVPKPAGLAALPWRKRALIALSAFVGGSLGSKLPFVPVNPTQWLDYASWANDGKTVVAGLIGAYLAVELTKWALDVRVKTGDTFALPLALALSVGRWGCFCNGCCYGVETSLPWGVMFLMPDGQWLKCHPTQVYESLFHFTMALILMQMTLRRALPGQRLKFYLIAYGVYRFATEFIRPEPVWWLGFTFYQWLALALILGLSLQWLAGRPGEVALPFPRRDRVADSEPA
jgi:phosphatidylglycerol---prolipoprotein diacylglyceryl transferase